MTIDLTQACFLHSIGSKIPKNAKIEVGIEDFFTPGLGEVLDDKLAQYRAERESKTLYL